MIVHGFGFSHFNLSIFDGVTQVAVMQAYFDASESQDGYYAVAGYVFKRSDVRPFERLWGRMLKEHSISYFHMTDCNSKKGEFEGKDDECDPCARKAIHAISQRATLGVISGIRVDDFNELMAPDRYMPGPFSVCAQGVLMMCAQWSAQNAPEAEFVHVFESGDSHQSDLDQILRSIDEDSERAGHYRYRAHAFHPKIKSFPVQSADVLAWHACKQWGRADRELGLRGDYKELLSNVETRCHLWSRDEIKASVEIPKAIHGYDRVGEVGGLYLRRNKANQKIIDRRISKILQQDG